MTHGVPAYIRSDNGPEFTSELVRLWLEALAGPWYEMRTVKKKGEVGS